MTMTVRTKLFAGFGAVLLLLAFVGIYGWRSTAVLSGEYADLYETNLRGAVHLANAQDALWRLRYGFPQFLVLTSPEDRRKITDEEPKLYAVVDENMKAYAAGHRSPDEREVLKEWGDVWPKYTAARPKWFELVAAGKMTRPPSGGRRRPRPSGPDPSRPSTSSSSCSARWPPTSTRRRWPTRGG